MKITYEDKVAIQNDESVARINKVTAEDMNEIKEAVNSNYSDLESTKADVKTNKTDITTIKTEQTTQNTELDKLKAENERLRNDLSGLPTGTLEGETIDITDSAEMRFSEFNVRGNSRQDGEPTPDTPIEVESCGDNVNLFDGETSEYGYYDINGVFQKGGIINRISDYIEVTNNTPYIASVNMSLGYFQINEFDKNKVWLKRTALNNVISNAITTGATTKYIRVSYNIDNNTDMTILKLKEIEAQFKKGSQILPYSPYGQGCINEVVCNKNLAKITAENQTTNGITITNNGDGSVTLKGTATAGTSFKIANIDIKSANYGYYTLSNKIVSGNYSTARLRTSLKNTKATANLIDKSIDEVWATNIQEDTGDLTIWCEKGVVLNNITILTQLEKGQGATEWELGEKQTFSIPTQQPMRSIGDIRDTFVKVDGKRVEWHGVNRYEYTGQETIGINAVNDTVNRFSITLSDINNSVDNANNIIAKSNCFIGISHNNRNNVNNSVFSICNGSSHTLAINTSKYSTVADFKAWLQSQYNAGTPVYVDYILKTPTDIECKPEQSTILDNLESTVKSYKGVTHIYSTDEVGANVEVTYKKDLNTMINKLNTAIISLGGI